MLDPLHDLPALALGHPPYRRPLRDVSCAEHGAATKPIAAAAMPLRQGHVARAPSLSAPPRPRLCAPGHPSPQCNAVRRAASAAPRPIGALASRVPTREAGVRDILLAGGTRP